MLSLYLFLFVQKHSNNNSRVGVCRYPNRSLPKSLLKIGSDLGRHHIILPTQIAPTGAIWVGSDLGTYRGVFRPKETFAPRRAIEERKHCKSNLDISKLMGLFFTSSNYPKCKFICTSGNLDL